MSEEILSIMPIKLLVVDDEPDLETLIRQRFRKKIRDAEFEFVFARNGVDALEKLDSDGEIDIVLTDINMPEMDGLTLLSKLAELDTPRKAIIVSAYGDMENIRTAMNRGAFDFLTKPIDFKDLEITIEKTTRELQMIKDAVAAQDRLRTVQQELEVATRIQRSIVPSVFPAFPERDDFELFGKMIPARDVGGDFYDFFLIDDDRLGIVIGDVAGKGIPAAIIMAVSRTLVKATALQGFRAADCLRQVNRLLCADYSAGLFVTLFYGIIDTATGKTDYCVAGHQPPYLIRKTGEVCALEHPGGLVLGVSSEGEYHGGEVELVPGDSLILYTDGVSEAMDGDKNLYSEARLEQVLRKQAAKPIPELVKAVFANVRAFSAGLPQTDDIAVLGLRYRGRNA
ncbi:MAG: fused response regulator/phosphatase [Candidatus Hydrogenedentota bacterium]